MVDYMFCFYVKVCARNLRFYYMKLGHIFTAGSHSKNHITTFI